MHIFGFSYHIKERIFPFLFAFCFFLSTFHRKQRIADEWKKIFRCDNRKKVRLSKQYKHTNQNTSLSTTSNELDTISFFFFFFYFICAIVQLTFKCCNSSPHFTLTQSFSSSLSPWHDFATPHIYNFISGFFFFLLLFVWNPKVNSIRTLLVFTWIASSPLEHTIATTWKAFRSEQNNNNKKGIKRKTKRK